MQKLNKTKSTHHRSRADGREISEQHTGDKQPHVSLLRNLERPTDNIILCGKQLRNARQAAMKRLLTGLSGHSLPCVSSCSIRSLIRGSRSLVPRLMAVGISWKIGATILGNESERTPGNLTLAPTVLSKLEDDEAQKMPWKYRS